MSSFRGVRPGVMARSARVAAGVRTTRTGWRHEAGVCGSDCIGDPSSVRLRLGVCDGVANGIGFALGGVTHGKAVPRDPECSGAATRRGVTG